MAAPERLNAGPVILLFWLPLKPFSENHLQAGASVNTVAAAEAGGGLSQPMRVARTAYQAGVGMAAVIKLNNQRSVQRQHSGQLIRMEVSYVIGGTAPLASRLLAQSITVCSLGLGTQCRSFSALREE
jgi:hypothetical protein